MDGVPSTIGIDGCIEDIGRAHDIGFDRFHRQEPAGRDLLECCRLENGTDTAHRSLEREVIVEVDDREGEVVGHGWGGGVGGGKHERLVFLVVGEMGGVI